MLTQYSISAWSIAVASVLLTGISKSGFGGALGGIAVPLLSLFLPPTLAAAAILPALCIMDACGLRAYWNRWDWDVLKSILPGGLIGIAIGSVLFGSLSTNTLKAIVGGIALLCALDRLFHWRAKATQIRTLSGPQSGIAWSIAAGVAGTLAHAGGPLILIYLLQRQLSKECFVATSVIYFAAMNLAKIVPYVALHLFTSETLQLALVLTVLAPLSVWLGYVAQKILPEAPFFKISAVLLGMTGIKLIADISFHA